MHALVLWFGFLGSWLLVAGPVFQAGVELRAEEEARERFRSVLDGVEVPPQVSGWWWLLPPVHVLLTSRRNRVVRRQVVASISGEDLELITRYLNIARGWMFVAGGAGLMALKETYELVEHHDGPVGVYWVLVVLMAALTLSVGRRGPAQRGRRRAGSSGLSPRASRGGG